MASQRRTLLFSCRIFNHHTSSMNPWDRSLYHDDVYKTSQKYSTHLGISTIVPVALMVTVLQVLFYLNLRGLEARSPAFTRFTPRSFNYFDNAGCGNSTDCWRAGPPTHFNPLDSMAQQDLEASLICQFLHVIRSFLYYLLIEVGSSYGMDNIATSQSYLAHIMATTLIIRTSDFLFVFFKLLWYMEQLRCEQCTAFLEFFIFHLCICMIRVATANVFMILQIWQSVRRPSLRLERSRVILYLVSRCSMYCSPQTHKRSQMFFAPYFVLAAISLPVFVVCLYSVCMYMYSPFIIVGMLSSS